MRTEKEIKEKLKTLDDNTNMSNYTKNFYWEQALNWVLEESESQDEEV